MAANRELDESREWLRVTLSSIGDGVLACDSAGRITFVNPVAAALTGWPPESALGQPIESVFHTIDEQTRRPAEDSAAPIRNSDGVVSGVVLVFHEVTETRRAEEALRRATDDWERTFDSVPDLIALLDDRQRIMRVNRAMAQRLGVPADECVGKLCYAAVHGTDAPPAFCPNADTLRDGKERAVEFHEERLGGDFMLSVTSRTSCETRSRPSGTPCTSSSTRSRRERRRLARARSSGGRAST